MTDKKELSEVTQELLKKIAILKKNIKKSMIRGEVSILKGIIIFEAMLIELNPNILDGDEITRIENSTRRYLIEKEEQTQHVDNYIHYGVNRCFLILETYNRFKDKKLTKKDKFLFTFD